MFEELLVRRPNMHFRLEKGFKGESGSPSMGKGVSRRNYVVHYGWENGFQGESTCLTFDGKSG